MIEDLHLKLTVLSILMEAGHFTAEVEALQDAHRGSVDYDEPIPEVMEFFSSVVLTEEQLALVTSLRPDGGDLAYYYATDQWDGEDDQFAITSLAGIETLVNLAEFRPAGWVVADADLAPLLGCPGLRFVDLSYQSRGPAQEAVIADLELRGVEVLRGRP